MVRLESLTKCFPKANARYDPFNKDETFMSTGQISRHTRNFDIDVKPCRDYMFRVGMLFMINFIEVVVGAR